jgi:hypothetical protein
MFGEVKNGQKKCPNFNLPKNFRKKKLKFGKFFKFQKLNILFFNLKKVNEIKKCCLRGYGRVG